MKYRGSIRISDQKTNVPLYKGGTASKAFLTATAVVSDITNTLSNPIWREVVHAFASQNRFIIGSPLLKKRLGRLFPVISDMHHIAFIQIVLLVHQKVLASWKMKFLIKLRGGTPCKILVAYFSWWNWLWLWSDLDEKNKLCGGTPCKIVVHRFSWRNWFNIQKYQWGNPLHNYSFYLCLDCLGKPRAAILI